MFHLSIYHHQRRIENCTTPALSAKTKVRLPYIFLRAMHDTTSVGYFALLLDIVHQRQPTKHLSCELCGTLCSREDSCTRHKNTTCTKNPERLLLTKELEKLFL